MKKKNLSLVILLSSALPALFLSCSRDNDSDKNSPAYHITESEKLLIPAEVDLPANFPGGNTRVATFYAEGVQKYKAQVKPGSSPVTYEWVFVAPKATLYGANNKNGGTHGAGPFWELSVSDSIFAQAFSPAKTVSPDAGSIPWLQLMPKSGKTATGIFASVSYIQRIATKGGKAPAIPPAGIADTADVFYTAVYRFTKKN